MKTIEEAAKEFSKTSRLPLTVQGGYIFEEGFIAGAEFMQKQYEEKIRWIPVEEEKPPLEMKDTFFNTHGYSETVIVKEKGIIYFGYYHYESENWIVIGRSGNIEVTHWRPIELK